MRPSVNTSTTKTNKYENTPSSQGESSSDESEGDNESVLQSSEDFASDESYKNKLQGEDDQEF